MKMFNKLSCKNFFIATFLLVTLPMGAANTSGEDVSEKIVMQDTNPNKEHYFSNRRALVGPGCMINSVGDGVKVLKGVKNLQNLCNEELNDYAELPGLASVDLGGSPVISVKDNMHYYAGGTVAGFAICAKSDASILTLNLAKFYKIQFLKDGENVGKLQDISTGKSITGLGLSLLTFPGSDQVDKLYMATAPGDFDEIKLVQCGIDAKLGDVVNLRYAFVGNAREYTITSNKDNGMEKYAQEQGRKPFTVEAHGKKPTHTALEVSRNDVIDENLNNGYTAVAGVLLSGSTPVTVVARPTDGKEAFPKGTEVGFKYNGFDLAHLEVGGGVELTLYNKENNEIGTYKLSKTVLGLGVIEVSKNGEFVMKAPADFSAAKIYFNSIGIKVGGTSVNYAFVRLAPDAATHHCAINATSSRDVSGEYNAFTLQHNEAVKVEWSIVKQPEGSNITLNPATGEVTNISISGKYVFKAQALEDDCYEYTTVNYAPVALAQNSGENILVNKEGEQPKFVLSDKSGGGVLTIFNDMQNESAILTPTLNDYAYREPGVQLIENHGLIGIKTADGSSFSESLAGSARAAFNGKMKAGFVVSAKATGLGADVFKFYNVKLFYKGKEIEGKVTTHWDAISAGLIGSEQTRKMRLSVDVPAGCLFDEIVLYNTGLLSADLAQLNIYYAYVADAETDNAATNMLYDAEVVSTQTTNASIDFANSTVFQTVNVGNGFDNLSNLIDNDKKFTTAYKLPKILTVGTGATIAVNIGKIVDKGQNLIMVTSDPATLLGLGLGTGIKMETYLNGKPKETVKSWKVLGADVIGGKGDGYAVLETQEPFDQVRITSAYVANLLDPVEIKGFALRTDKNDDGTVNTQSDVLILNEDVKLNETKAYTKAKMLLRRTFTKNADGTKGWNSIILPVDMTAAQVIEAFGKGTQIAKFNDLDENWIKFETVNVAGEGVVLEKNTPYIIFPTQKAAYNNYEYNINGETKTLNGPVYVAEGINYEDQTAHIENSVEGSLLNNMTFYGSYDNKTAVSADSYMFSKGDLVHTSKPHTIKAYRCWLKENTPSGKLLQLSLNNNNMGNSTGIQIVEENKRNANPGIYNMEGMRMNTNNVNELSKGVYIVNNKTVVITK